MDPYYSDHGIRARRPGTAEYAAQARKDLWPDLPSFLESIGLPLVSDAASLAKLIEAERTGTSSRMDRALAIAALLPFVPGTVDTLGKKIPKVVQRNDEKFKAAHDAAMLPIDQGGLALPQGNTAMDRARAMGYNQDTYHYSRVNNEFERFEPWRSTSEADFDRIGVHSGTKKSALDRYYDTNKQAGIDSGETANGYTMPLMIQTEKEPHVVFDYNGLPTEDEVKDYLDITGTEGVWELNKSIPYINLIEHKGSTSYLTPPNRVRSRFAAFNPLLKNSSNLLASGITAAMLLNYLNRDSDAQ